MIEAWVPTIVSGGALGLVWLGFRTQKTRTDNRIDDIEKNQEKYIPEEKHKLICENATLKTNEHLTAELKALKEEICIELRSLEKLIRNNGKG